MMKWGIAGAALAVVLNNLADPWGFKKMLSIINCEFRKFSRNLLLPTISSIFLCLFLQTIKNLVEIRIGEFIFLIILGGLFYLIVAYFLDGKINANWLKIELSDIFKSFIAKSKEEF